MGRDDRAGTRPRDAGHVPFGVDHPGSAAGQGRSIAWQSVSAWFLGAPADVGGADRQTAVARAGDKPPHRTSGAFDVWCIRMLSAAVTPTAAVTACRAQSARAGPELISVHPCRDSQGDVRHRVEGSCRRHVRYRLIRPRIASTARPSRTGTASLSTMSKIFPVTVNGGVGPGSRSSATPSRTENQNAEPTLRSYMG
jgi:hypothetical protein